MAPAGTDPVQRLGEVAGTVIVLGRQPPATELSKGPHLSPSTSSPFWASVFLTASLAAPVTCELPWAPGGWADGNIGSGVRPLTQFQWQELPGSLLVGHEAQTTGDSDVP